jgi:hypothetical protein
MLLAANKIAHNIKKTALVSKANNLHTTTNEEGKGGQSTVILEQV